MDHDLSPQPSMPSEPTQPTAAVPPATAPEPPEIPELDAAAITAARAVIDADPRVGRLAEVLAWVAGTQAAAPRPFRSPVVLVAGEPVALTDDGLPCRSIETGYDAGVAAVDREVDGGTDLLLVGGGAGAESMAVVSVLTGREPVACVRRDHPDWTLTVAAVRDARRRGKPCAAVPLELLEEIGGSLAGLVGVLVQAAVRRTPVLLDGLDALAAGLLAEAYAPGCSLWWALASASGEPAEAFTAASLELQPLLSLGLSYGGAAASRLALPILQAALAALD